ncbi:poly [ADP-ribose] polymerase 14, partial [Biomphalaria glabrata]
MTQNLFESCQFILRKDYQLNEKTEREIKRLGYRITNLDPIKLEIDDLNDDIFKNLFLALTSTDPIDSLCTKLNTLNFVDDPNQNIPFIDSESSLDNSKTPVLTNSETKINITISDFKTHNLLKESLGSDLDESLKQKQNDVMTHTQNCSLISSNHIYEINSQQNNRNATEVSATSEVESAQCNESQVLLGLNADYSHLADEDGFQETVYEPSKESSNDDFSNKNISDHQDKSKSDSTSDNESSLKTKDEIIGKGVAGMNKMQGTESEKTTEGEKDRKENELKTDESIEYGCHDNDQNNVNVKPVQKNEFQDDKEKTSVDDDEKKIYEKINKDTEECNADFDKRGFSKKENKPHGHVFNENIVKICIHSRNLTWVKYYFQDTGTEIEEYLNKAMFDENNHAYIIQVNEKHDLMKQNVHILNKFKVSNISDVSESEAENLKMFIKKDLACHTLKTKYDIEKQIFYVMGNADQVKSTISSLLSLRGNRDHEIYWAQWMEQKENDSSSYEMDHKQDSSLNDSKEREKNYRASEMHSELESKTFLKDFPGDVMSFTNAMAKAENSDDSSQMFKNQEKNLFKFNDYGFHNGKKRCIDSAGDKRSFFIGINELKVIVNKADITKLNVDIIVNAANRHLKHDGGVASVISKAAGSKMVRECDEFINKFGPLDVTEVFVSSGGNLNAKYIMHAVGPKWSSYSESQKNECAKHLRQTVLRCLVEASRHGAQTIALPSISAAIFRVPKELCANCYLEAVQNFDCIRQDLNLTSLQEIMFVDINDDLVNLIQETFITRWEHWNDSYLVNEDLNFAKNHLAAQKNQSRTISPKLTQTHNKTKSSPFASSLVQRATEKVYQLNRLKIYVSLKPALVSSNEMLIVIGEPFNEISGLSYFKVDDCIQKDGNLKNLTLLKVVTPNRIPHKICSLYCNVKDKKKIGQAFKHLASSLDLKYISGKEENSLVLTSKILYPGMTKLDGNLVRDFAEAVYKYIQHVSHDTKVKHIRIASSEDAYHNIIEVFDAKSDLKEIQQ